MTARRWAALASSVALLATACTDGSTATADDTDVAAQIAPEVEAFLETVDPFGQVRAVLVYHDGKPVLERYTGATPEDYWDTRSVTKSVMATLIGIAIAQGQIQSVDQTRVEAATLLDGQRTRTASQQTGPWAVAHHDGPHTRPGACAAPGSRVGRYARASAAFAATAPSALNR